MNEKELFEKQYGKKKLVYPPSRQFWGIRNLLKKYDYDRGSISERLIMPGDRVLDIGCGAGYFLRKISSKYKELYGMDISSSILQEAEEKTKETYPQEAQKFKWIESIAAEPLPFPDEFFDTIVSISTVHFIYDIFSLIREIRRVLKDRGCVVVEVSNIAYLPRRLALLFGKLPAVSAACNWEEIGWDGGVIHYFTMNKLCWLFESNGFCIKKRSGSGFLANFRNFWPSLLCGNLIIKAEKI
jgi:ubiquinone/menaquinone biosynthesis C-methylase UbiE